MKLVLICSAVVTASVIRAGEIFKRSEGSPPANRTRTRECGLEFEEALLFGNRGCCPPLEPRRWRDVIQMYILCMKPGHWIPSTLEVPLSWNHKLNDEEEAVHCALYGENPLLFGDHGCCEGLVARRFRNKRFKHVQCLPPDMHIPSDQEVPLDWTPKLTARDRRKQCGRGGEFPELFAKGCCGGLVRRRLKTKRFKDIRCVSDFEKTGDHEFYILPNFTVPFDWNGGEATKRCVPETWNPIFNYPDIGCCPGLVPLWNPGVLQLACLPLDSVDYPEVLENPKMRTVAAARRFSQARRVLGSLNVTED